MTTALHRGKPDRFPVTISDHFFDAPVENLRAFSVAAVECAY